MVDDVTTEPSKSEQQKNKKGGGKHKGPGKAELIRTQNTKTRIESKINEIVKKRQTYYVWERIDLITKDIEEARIWVDRIKLYQKIHGCRISINSDFEEINKSFESYYHTNGIDFYKTYNIGRFPKTSSDFRTMDHRKEGLIWYGNWKTFWSYQHPRKWTDLTSQEIVDDILGL